MKKLLLFALLVVGCDNFPVDCAGMLKGSNNTGWTNGDAYLDACEVCSGGNSGHTANSDMDCNDECFGTAELDECGVCDNDLSNDNTTCTQDECGVWGGDGSTCIDDCLDGYDCGDFQVLQNIIDENLTTYIESMDSNNNNTIEPLELGIQTWEDGYLIEFTCNDLDIYDFFGDLLVAYECELSGQLTEHIGDFSKLEHLNLSHNNLAGQLPISIYELSSLNNLYLSNNNFEGSISNQICNLNLNWQSQIEDGEYATKDPSNISNNQFCPPHPDCLTAEEIGEQDCD